MTTPASCTQCGKSLGNIGVMMPSLQDELRHRCLQCATGGLWEDRLTPSKPPSLLIRQRMYERMLEFNGDIDHLRVYCWMDAVEEYLDGKLK